MIQSPSQRDKPTDGKMNSSRIGDVQVFADHIFTDLHIL